jgi:hypothetical protein
MKKLVVFLLLIGVCAGSLWSSSDSDLGAFGERRSRDGLALGFGDSFSLDDPLGRPIVSQADTFDLSMDVVARQNALPWAIGADDFSVDIVGLWWSVMGLRLWVGTLANGMPSLERSVTDLRRDLLLACFVGSGAFLACVLFYSLRA